MDMDDDTLNNLTKEQRTELGEKLEGIRKRTIWISLVPIISAIAFYSIFGFPLPAVAFILHQLITWVFIGWTFYRVIRYRPRNWSNL